MHKTLCTRSNSRSLDLCGFYHYTTMRPDANGSMISAVCPHSRMTPPRTASKHCVIRVRWTPQWRSCQPMVKPPLTARSCVRPAQAYAPGAYRDATPPPAPNLGYAAHMLALFEGGLQSSTSSLAARKGTMPGGYRTCTGDLSCFFSGLLSKLM